MKCRCSHVRNVGNNDGEAIQVFDARMEAANVEYLMPSTIGAGLRRRCFHRRVHRAFARRGSE
jgi:hypothetical protein